MKVLINLFYHDRRIVRSHHFQIKDGSVDCTALNSEVRSLGITIQYNNIERFPELGLTIITVGGDSHGDAYPLDTLQRVIDRSIQ